MASKPTARPAKKPARAVAVRKPAKKPVVVNAPAKKTAPHREAAKPDTEPLDASVATICETNTKPPAEAARQKTRAATLVIGGPGRVRKQPGVVADPIEVIDIATGDPTERDVAATKVVRKTVTKKAPAVKPSPRPPRHSAVERLSDVPADLPLTERVVKVIERELGQIERIVRNTRLTTDHGMEADRRVRTLAVLARTLTELKKARAGEEHRSGQDDDRPRDLDELRRRLHERLAKRLEGAPVVPAGGDVARRGELPE